MAKHNNADCRRHKWQVLRSGYFIPEASWERYVAPALSSASRIGISVSWSYIEKGNVTGNAKKWRFRNLKTLHTESSRWRCANMLQWRCSEEAQVLSDFVPPHRIMAIRGISNDQDRLQTPEKTRTLPGKLRCDDDGVPLNNGQYQIRVPV